MKGKTEGSLITVIVAAYNIEAYLPRCLESLLAQSYENMEIIVVDDGSRDGTGRICDSYARKDKRIRVIHQANKGLSGARNAALEIACGDYIGYVDGDDWVEPDMYKEMLLACEKNRAQVAVCAYRERGAQAGQEIFSGKTYVLDQEEALETYICDNRQYHIYNSVWSKLFGRETVRKIRFPEGRKSEDIIYTTRAFLNIDTCVFIDRPYYNYVVDRENSIMNKGLAERRFLDEIPFWKEQIECIKEAGLVRLGEMAAYHFYRRMLFYYVDFRSRGMKEAGRKLAGLLRGERQEIGQIYQKDFVAAGDRARMKLALLCPGAYFQAVRFYDKFIIPLRQS